MANTLKGKLTPKNNMKGSLTNEGRLTGQLGGVGAAVTYASLPDKPSINNVELVGNKTTSDLNISYNDLRDQPDIPDVGEIDERLDNLEGNITSLGGRVTTAEGDITSLSGRVTTAEGDITSLGGRLTTAEGNITTLQGDTGALNTRLTTAEGDITSLGGRVTTAEGNITSLDGRVTTNDGDISDLKDDMTQAQSDITQLNSSFAISITFSNGTNINSSAYKLGKLVIVNIDFTPSVDGGAGGSVIISGLPSAKTLEWSTLADRNNTRYCTCQIDSNGISIKLFHSISGTRYIGQLVYLAN